MAHRKSNSKKHTRTLTITDEISTILKGTRRANFQKLEHSFDLSIEGKTSLTIKHNNPETLERAVTFLQQTLIPQAIEINTKAREDFAEDETQQGEYRPRQKEIDAFRNYFESALTSFISESLAAATKLEKVTAKFQKQAAAKPANAAVAPLARANGQKPAAALNDNRTAARLGLKPIEFRGPKGGLKQRTHYQAIEDRNTDLVFSIGRTGSGKTFTSLHASLAMLQRGDIEKIYLIRPYVPSGRHRMGDVPGNEAKKLGGLMKGVIDNIHKVIDPACELNFSKLAEKGLIELQPLDKSRSMTFDNCVVIITEAQNVDYDHSDILERIGENCTFVLDGSLEQKDVIVAYPTLIDWVLQYADDPLTPFIFYNEDVDGVRSPQSQRHAQARLKPMPEGYVDFRAYTPEYTRNGPLQDAIKANTILARQAAKTACARTLGQYDPHASYSDASSKQRKGRGLRH